MCVLDPEGDYRSLEALPGVAVLGGEDPPPSPRELRRALRYPDRSLVIDLSRLAHDEKIAKALGWVLCGGDLSAPQWVTEQYILDLELEETMKLIAEPKTQERMMALLQTGKPLRN